MSGRLQSNIDATRAAQDQGAAERRTSLRHSVRLQADVTLPGDLTMVAHTLDMSTGGIALDVPYMLKFGQQCLIELDLSAIGGPPWLQLRAEVRHCRQINEGRFLAGVQLVDPDPVFTELFAGML